MLFGGEYYQMIRSKGRSRSKPSVSYQPFFSISLDINEERIQTVSAALRNHFCKAHTVEYRGGTANKSELISESPFFLVLHLKRFLFEEGQMFKLNKFVAYDTKLTLPPQ